MRCHITPGAPLTATCMECNHQVHSHIHPSGMCVDCLDTRVERLVFAVQVLSERLDDAHLDRLDAICAAWPKRERTDR